MLNGFGPSFFDDNGEPVPGAAAYLDENTWSVPMPEPTCPEGMFHDEWIESLEAEAVRKGRKAKWAAMTHDERMAALEADEIPY